MDPAWEQTLAACRANLASDPDKAVVEAQKLLTEARTNSERVRATLTIGRAHKNKGVPEVWRETLEKAEKYRRPGPLARSDLAVHWGQFHLHHEDIDAAAVAADRAVELAEPLAAASPRSRRRYNVASVVPRTTYAAALITRGQVRVCQGRAKEALPDALTALAWVDPRFSGHVHIAGLTTLGTILVRPGVGTAATAHEVLKLCSSVNRILASRRIKARHPHRIMLRGLEALALGLLGSVERAETLLARTAREYMAAGLEQDARLFFEHMVWVVGQRAGQVGRARLLAQRHGLSVKPTPQPRKPPKDKDEDEPIGF